MTNANVNLVLSGIIAGDVVGSKYNEPQPPPDPETLYLYGKNTCITKNTILPLATYYATRDILREQSHELSDKEIIETYAHYYHEFTAKVQDTGEAGVIASSIFGAMFNCPTDVIRYAALSAAAIHDDEEKAKDAIALAIFIWMGLHSYDKDAYRKLLTNMHVSETISKAVFNVLESDSCKSCIRNAFQQHSDNGEIVAISGGIAAAHHKPKDDALLQIAEEKLEEVCKELGFEI